MTCRFLTAAAVVLIIAGFLASAIRADAAVIARYTFDGPTGATPAPWAPQDPAQCGTIIAGTTCPVANSSIDGRGHLVLRVTPGQGAFTGTFQYGTGFPPRVVRGIYDAPATFTVRMRMPAATGVWAGGLWVTQVDRYATQGIDELEPAEERSGVPDVAECWDHRVRDDDGNGRIDRQREDHLGHGVAPARRAAWHTYAVRVTARAVTYRVDGRRCFRRAPGAVGRFGLLAFASPTRPGSWAAGYGPGFSAVSARVLIDRVTVTRP
jgi:hypothetical protein